MARDDARGIAYAAPGNAAPSVPSRQLSKDADSRSEDEASHESWEEEAEKVVPWKHFKWIVIYPLSFRQIAYPIYVWVSVAAAGTMAFVNAAIVLVCGLFMWSNASLFASMLRLWHEIARFRRTNEKFGKDIEEQGIIVRKLQKTAAAFKQIDTRYAGSVQHAASQIDQLRQEIAMKLKNSTKDICMLYTDTGKHYILDAGEELDNTFDVFADIFGDAIPEYDKRIYNLQNTLFKSEKYKDELKGLTVSALSDLMQIVVEEANPDDIGARVEKYIEAMKVPKK